MPAADTPQKTTTTTELWLRVNGIQPSYGVEFGVDHPRKQELCEYDPYRQANTSYSLVQHRRGQIVRHTLIDVGMNVVPSLLDFERSHGVNFVNEAFISHPHLDHFAQLKWLAGCCHRSRQTNQPKPLPVYATEPCWREGPHRVFPWIEPRAVHRPLEFGQPVVLDDLTITPFAVDHGPTAPGASGFAIAHGGRRIVITGDFMRIPDRDHALLQEVDVCFIEANTWHPSPQTKHTSVTENIDLIRHWRPKRTYLIHYSGFEDGEQMDHPIRGPLPLSQLREATQQAVGELAVDVATHGMILGESIPWP